MTQDKKLCGLIMICQMTAILSGVAMLYLAVIVIIPSKSELEMGINLSPLMCSTVYLDNINLKSNPDGTPLKCEWASCREWCLSKVPSLCLQIYVRPRLKGANITLEGCDNYLSRECSALNISNARIYRCKMGECKDLDGLYNCSRINTTTNDCVYLSPAYECKSKFSKEPIECNEEKCSDPLEGVVICEKGKCERLLNITSYKNCRRKCTDLTLENHNSYIFSLEHIHGARCTSVTSSNGTDQMKSLTYNSDWVSGKSALMIFCTYVTRTLTGYELDDCFNGTLGNTNDIRKIRDYRVLQAYHIDSPLQGRDWILDPEELLQVMNDTKLQINSEACVNTLIKECTRFFDRHTHDERDGRTRHRFPCFFSKQSDDFVTAEYNPEETRLYLILASSIPAGMFVLSCACLYLCSKLIESNEEGHLQIRSFKKDPIPADASEL